jgi:hypothetical protein
MITKDSAAILSKIQDDIKTTEIKLKGMGTKITDENRTVELDKQIERYAAHMSAVTYSSGAIFIDAIDSPSRQMEITIQQHAKALREFSYANDELRDAMTKIVISALNLKRFESHMEWLRNTFPDLNYAYSVETAIAKTFAEKAANIAFLTALLKKAKNDLLPYVKNADAWICEWNLLSNKLANLHQASILLWDNIDESK